MTEKIKQHLAEIEKKYHLKIFHACETGSRAWGFPSFDSDYDVRFIYMHHKDWYLSLKEGKDTLDIMLDGNITDLSGWDIRKSLRLLWKSNPPLLEKIHSQIVYVSNESFMTELRELTQKYYSRIATHYHYFNMAENSIKALEGEKSYRLKKFFYALRATVACKWIMEKEEIPPVYFPAMLEKLDISPDIQSRIHQLITFKLQKSESYEHSGDHNLIDFIKDLLQSTANKANQLPGRKGNFDELDTFFKSTLN